MMQKKIIAAAVLTLLAASAFTWTEARQSGESAYAADSSYEDSDDTYCRPPRGGCRGWYDRDRR